MTANKLVRVKIWFAHLKAIEMKMQKLVWDLFVAQILPEKINKTFLPKKLWFIDVLSTANYFKSVCHQNSITNKSDYKLNCDQPGLLKIAKQNLIS